MSKLSKRNWLPVLASSCLISFAVLPAFADEQPAKTAAVPASEVESSKEAVEETKSEPKGPTKEEKVALWGSENIAIRAGNAARAIKKENFSAAISNFRALIGLDSSNEDFYLGLYYCGVKNEDWNQAYLGLEELFEIKPDYKKKLAKQFAEVLRQSGEDDEAAEMDKLASKSGGDGNAFVEKHVNDFVDKAFYVKEKYVPPKPIEPAKRDAISEDQVHIHKSKYGLTFENAFQRSEKIIVAEYKSFEDDGSISYYAPPKAVFKRIDMLKGAKVNPTFFIRFEFHNKIDEPKPDGWKFSKDLMPKEGEKFIIFIPNAIPVDGMYETYHGKFGIQPYNEKNLDKILRIIEQHKGQTTH